VFSNSLPRGVPQGTLRGRRERAGRSHARHTPLPAATHHIPYATVAQKAGQTFGFNIRNSNGRASRCLKPNQCEAATSGSVVFDIVDEGKEAKGRYELHFKDWRDRRREL
jgi:hypothetical protein